MLTNQQSFKCAPRPLWGGGSHWDVVYARSRSLMVGGKITQFRSGLIQWHVFLMRWLCVFVRASNSRPDLSKSCWIRCKAGRAQQPTEPGFYFALFLCITSSHCDAAIVHHCSWQSYAVLVVVVKKKKKKKARWRVRMCWRTISKLFLFFIFFQQNKATPVSHL